MDADLRKRALEALKSFAEKADAFYGYVDEAPAILPNINHTGRHEALPVAAFRKARDVAAVLAASAPDREGVLAGARLVSDLDKRWRIEAPRWSMQPVGEVSADEARAICEAALRRPTEAGGRDLTNDEIKAAWRSAIQSGVSDQDGVFLPAFRAVIEADRKVRPTEAATQGWHQTIEPAVPLASCPVGLFLNGHGNLCLKTEYGNNDGRIDAYIVQSGEFFWGDDPQTISNQRRQLVRPVKLAAAPQPPSPAPTQEVDRGA